MPNPLPLSITGAPLTTTADPNGTAPGSVVPAPWTSPPHAQSGDDSSALELELVDGTSATVMLWIWTQGTEWAQLGSVTLSAVHVVSAPVGAFGGGATIYAQVTAASGSPTTIRAGFTRPLPGTTGLVISNLPAVQASAPATVSVAFSAALEASHVVKNAAGTFYGYSGRLDATAPTGTYFVQALDASSLPPDGAVTMLVGAVKIQHLVNVDDYPFVDLGHVAKAAANGIVVVLSTTEFTKTISGAYLSITEARYS